MQIFSYVIEHDVGFAPNPFHGVCTLACCKPKIRSAAEKGDYIIGTSSAKPKLSGHLCYWMRVDDVLTFDQYWNDQRFFRKRPVMYASRYIRYGDNIYHRTKDGKSYLQEDSFHSLPNGQVCPQNLKRDTGSTDRVLIGYEFAYWGRSGKPLPKEFSDFVHKGPSHRSTMFSENRKAAFLHWLSTQTNRGYCGEPVDWLLVDRKEARARSRAQQLGLI